MIALTTLWGLTASSQVFIDDYKVRTTDTLGCFTFQKIKVFASTKVDLNECIESDSVMSLKIEYLDSVNQSLKENSIDLKEQVSIKSELYRGCEVEKENIIRHHKKDIRRHKIISIGSISVGVVSFLVAIFKSGT